MYFPAEGVHDDTACLLPCSFQSWGLPPEAAGGMALTPPTYEQTNTSENFTLPQLRPCRTDPGKNMGPDRK